MCSTVVVVIVVVVVTRVNKRLGSVENWPITSLVFNELDLQRNWQNECNMTNGKCGSKRGIARERESETTSDSIDGT